MEYSMVERKEYTWIAMEELATYMPVLMQEYLRKIERKGPLGK